MASRPGTRFRFWLLALVFIVGYGAIGARLVELHAIKRPVLLSELRSSRDRVITLNPRRGEIVDRNGELIATSQSFLELGVDPSLVEANDAVVLPDLAKILDLPLSELEAAFGFRSGRLVSDPAAATTRWRLLKRRVTESEYRAIGELKLRCVYGNRSYERVYPKNAFAAHVVGYVRQDGLAVYGIEREYDFYLSGQRGWKESEVGGRIGEMAQFRRRHVEAIDGMSVELTLDSYVQYAVEDELARIAERLKPESASIIVSDPYTGAILGLANYPSFDPNRYSDYPVGSLKNRALTDPVEPGSTFKIVAASAALDERLVNPDTEIDCGKDTVTLSSGYVARLPRDSHSNGILSVAEVVAKSSNRGAAQLGVLLGEQEFYDYVKKYGFGQHTGLDLGQESIGILNPPNKWDGLTLTRMTMGHAVAATPLQIHLAMASVANGGVLMKPIIVSRIVDAEGKEVARFGPVSRRRVISRSTAETMAHLLEKTASPGGTAAIAAIPGYHIAGKTGTSQKIVDGRYSSSHHVGSFSGFFPAKHPQVVITVIVDGAQVPGVAYGSTVAAPSFKTIAEKLIPHYAISPTDDAGRVAFRGGRRSLVAED